MKNIGKEILRHSAWIVVVCLLLFKHCEDNKEINKVYQDIISKDQIIAEKTTEIGTIQSTVKTKEVEFSKALKSKDQSIVELKNKLRDMGIHKNDIETIINNTILVTDTIYVPLEPIAEVPPPLLLEEEALAFAAMDIAPTFHDSLFLQPFPKKFTYRDKWMDLDGKVFEDSVKLTYSLWEEHTLVTHYRRPGFFKPRELVMEFESTNPNAKLIGSEVFVEKSPKPVLSIGATIGVGAGYNGSQLVVGPYIGIGVTYPIYTFYNKKK